ncbi:MAG: hypothetical protein KatS3mg068_1236 [Candidatus Sericytochromatia bacterium]|nr:MAG: hypothetical protein KatS3mg068_1236 [Candidatus Sericytochromatia bacterium]
MSMSIIIEGLRRLDESNALKEKYNYNLVPKIINNYNIENQDILNIFKLIDNSKNIKQIIDSSDLDRYTVLTSIKDLEERSIISFE